MGATFSDIIRGTFRISVVAAALAAAYSAYMTWDKYSAAVERHLELVSTIRCGSHIEEATLKPFENELGLIDLSKTGCSDRQFFTSYKELHAVRDGKMGLQPPYPPPAFSAAEMSVYALFAFVAVNLLGFALIGVSAVARWVKAGFAPGG